MKTLRDLPPPDPLALMPNRVHEAAGRGRRAFALFQAVRRDGPLVWVLPAHLPEFPMPAGLPHGVADRLHLLRPDGEVDVLWCIEESLRNPAIALVIGEPQHPLSLTAGRRLQLAAEAGRTTGLMLITEMAAGSNATETRWQCHPMAGETPDSTLHRWTLNKNKRGTFGDWVLHWDGTSAAFDMVSALGQRHQPAPAAAGGAFRADASVG